MNDGEREMDHDQYAHARADHEEMMQSLNQMAENQRQIDRCHIFDRERYQQQLYEYFERVRHDMNLQRGQGFQPIPTVVDYSRATTTDQINLPFYPGLPPPMHWQQDFRPGDPQPQNPFDKSTVARNLSDHDGALLLCKLSMIALENTIASIERLSWKSVVLVPRPKVHAR
ncbi:hypothetical protein L1987_65628 [Smallanthus sonchifolius]|uniref:Uncharacterized protein n=1 Tax=Smallanthus sonchifolius TaxID=185202 RepID=A0ACB9BV24_9ASTR|nr:hypothetical protein L1987_65628 [Smallanthus sonchifolius]